MTAAALEKPRIESLTGLGLRLEHRPVESLIPYACNARVHSDEQVALIAGSIREFGFTNRKRRLIALRRAA